MSGSKELVLGTIEQKKTGTVPVDYMPAYRTDKALRSRLGFSNDAHGEKQLLDYLGSDIYYLSARDISQNEGFYNCWKKKPEMSEAERTCAFGIRWTREVHEAKFSVDENISAPLKGVSSEKEILTYPWPEGKDFDFTLLAEEAEDFSQRAVIGGLWSGILGDAYRMIGFQDFLLKIALEPALIRTLVEKLTDVYLELNDAYFAALKGKMDIWFFGNDFGSQNGLLVSRDMWLDFFFEPLKRMCALARSYGLKVMMHSCGGISPLISDLAEAGVDVLDPVQISARDMDPDRLVRDFGGKIAFHGGIDTQQVLPFGSTEEVLEHCEYVVGAFRSGAGYIASGSQILGHDIPIDTILSVYAWLKRMNSNIV
jgi:uroporphyrinogen decarboxylase